MKHLSFICLLAVFSTTGLFFSCHSTSADLSFEALRLRQKDRITGGEANLDDSVIISRIATMDRFVRSHWNDMNRETGRQYLWNDRECQDDSISPFRPASVTTSISRLSGMATAYATKGSAFYQDQAMKKDVIEGMEWMYAHKWSPRYPMYGNWWDWIIGMPGSVNNLLTVMYDDFTPEQRVRYIEALDFYAPGVTFEGASTGANKIWQCSSMILRGILAHDERKIQMGVDGIDSEFQFVTSHDGFYKDGSFLQHQWHPYTGGYGASFLRDIVYLMQLVHGSQWEIGASYMDMLCEWLENAYLPLIFDGAMTDMVRGREIAREVVSDRTTGHTILLSAYNISKMANTEVKNRLQARIKYEILADRHRDFITNDVPVWQLSELRAFLNEHQITAQAPAPAHHQFSVMDRVVHRRPGFAVGLAMSSDRIENYESIDSENMKAWHTSDGMTYIYNGDQAQYTDHFWSTVDYYRLPGITVDAQQQHEVKSLVFGKGILYADGYKSPKSYVGGASIEGLYGISGMWFADEKSTLQAKKTWFMVGDEVVALGAGINSADFRTIETIIDNRKINGVAHIMVEGKEALPNDGTSSQTHASWVHFETSIPGTKMGYFFPAQSSTQLTKIHGAEISSGASSTDDQSTQLTKSTRSAFSQGAPPAGSQNVHIMKMPRTGSWRDISKYGDPTPVTRDYFTIWFDHGKNPTQAKYAYILLPGKTAEEVKSYASSPNMEILFNTPQAQVVKAKKEGVTGWNFWEAPSAPVAGVSVSAPAAVILRETETELIVGISDPTQKGKTLTVALDRPVSGVSVENHDIQLLSIAPLRLQVNVDKALGSTRCITLKK